jgi:hypothetical protein
MEFLEKPAEAVDSATRYRPRNREPFSVAKAAERILRLLAAAGEAQNLARLSPEDIAGKA